MDFLEALHVLLIVMVLIGMATGLSGATAVRSLELIDDATDRYRVSVELSMAEQRYIPRLTETLPEGWELVSGSMDPAGQVLSATEIRWQFVSLAPVATVVSYDVRPAAASGDTSAFSGIFTGVEPVDFTTETTVVSGVDALYRLTTHVTGAGSVQRLPANIWHQVGARVVLRAVSIGQASFTGWSGWVESAETEIEIVIAGPMTLSAGFEEAWRVERVVTDRGTVSIDPEREIFADGEWVSLFAEAAFGYEFIGWAGIFAGEVANPLSVVVDRDLIVQAQFVELAWPTSVHRRITPGPANQTRVDMDIYPDLTSTVYAVQEDIPQGWQVVEVSTGGIVDARTSRVKWGLYFDNRLRSVYYVLSPAAALPPEVVASGTTSIDGRPVTASGGEQILPSAGTANTIVALGDAHTYTTADGVQVSRRLTPASGIHVYAYEESIPHGWAAVEINELGHFDTRRSKVKWGLFFGDAPRELNYRLVPAAGGLPIEVVLGGRLALDGSLNPLIGGERLDPAPLTHGTAVAEFGSAYRSGFALPVEIHVTPRADQSVFAVEHQLPTGWRAEQISDNGHFDVRRGKVKWGLFFGPEPTAFSYLAISPWGETRNVIFSGLASFDGVSNAIFGERDSEHGEYSRWLQYHFRTKPFMALDDLDPDGDGISNLIEYAFGRNPLFADAGNLVETFVEEGWLIVSVQLARLDISVNIQESTDLKHWQPASTAVLLSDGQADGLHAYALPIPVSGSKMVCIGMNYAP